jgi:hypothetical protein
MFHGPMPALLGALASWLIGAGIAAPRPAGVPRDQPSRVAATEQDQGVPLGRARVSGRIIAPGGRRLVSGAVIMTPASGAAMGTPADMTILPDGTFVFRNVPPGQYEIRARGEIAAGGTMHFATFRVVVERTDVTGIQMPLAPGSTVSGTLVLDGVHSPKAGIPQGIRVRAPLIDGNGYGDALTGDVLRGGAYSIRGVAAGSHFITVEGLPYPWVLESVTARGQDITDVGLEAEAGRRYENVRITITDTATEVSGVVRDASGRSVPGALVFIIPLSQQFWHRASRRFGLLRTDDHGGFSIRGLPEGEYRAAASLEVDERDAERTALLERLSDAGAALSLQPGAARSIDLSLTPAATVPGASKR